MTKKQIMNLLGAGTMTIMLLGAGLLFSGRGTLFADTGDFTDQQILEMAQSEASLLLENNALRETIAEFQDREVEYTQLVDQANAMLVEQNSADVSLAAENDALYQTLTELETREAAYAQQLVEANALLESQSGDVASLQAENDAFLAAIEATIYKH